MSELPPLDIREEEPLTDNVGNLVERVCAPFLARHAISDEIERPVVRMSGREIRDLFDV